MIRSNRPAALALLPMLLSGCDSGGITIVPEVQQSFGFESGLGGWEAVAESSDGGSAVAAVSTEQASSGSASVRLFLDDPSGTAAAFIARAFELEPGRGYDVELRFAFGTADAAAGGSWSVRAGATASRPEGGGALVSVGSTAGSGSGFGFDARTVSLSGTAGEGGTLWVALGVGQDTGGTREYFLDDVEVVLTRR